MVLIDEKRYLGATEHNGVAAGALKLVFHGAEKLARLVCEPTFDQLVEEFLVDSCPPRQA